jgi:hypothetical protein
MYSYYRFVQRDKRLKATKEVVRTLEKNQWKFDRESWLCHPILHFWHLENPDVWMDLHLSSEFADI